MEHGAKAHLKHLTEYFGFLYEFSKMGEDEAKFLLAVGSINMMVYFYLGHKDHDFVSFIKRYSFIEQIICNIIFLRLMLVKAKMKRKLLLYLQTNINQHL